MKSEGYPGKYGPLPEATPCNQSELIKALGAMTDQEKAAALRFCDTCYDGEGYDVPKDMMARLESLGLIIYAGQGRYEGTGLFNQVIAELRK